MITFYMKCSDGSLCKAEAETWDNVNYLLFRLIWGMTENGDTFDTIKKSEFKRLKKSRFFNVKSSVIEDDKKIITGFYTEYITL